MKAVIDIFNAVPVKNRNKTAQPSDHLLKKTVERGFVFSPEALGNYNETELLQLIDNIGLSSEEMNSSFHKSWRKVRDESSLMLVVEQMVHYLTTYGFENLGIYSEDTIYIPNEQLTVPEFSENNVNLTVIHGLTDSEIKEKAMNLLSSGIALGEETLEKLYVVLDAVTDFTEEDFDRIANKEFRCYLYDKMGRIPHNNVEFLRFLLYKSIGSTLLIKNSETIESLKQANKATLYCFMESYNKEVGLDKLAQIFYRYKPLFLAMKPDGFPSELTTIINRLRKLARKNHKPMKEDFLNSVTEKISKGEEVDFDVLDRELEKVNTFRKIRLAYALKYRTNSCADSIMYKIRNGKGWIQSFDFNVSPIYVQRILDHVIGRITGDVRKNVEGKRIYIPEYVQYALPSSEKQFAGNIPNCSCVHVPDDMVYGVHWKDNDDWRVDLDLAQVKADGTKIGWDANYRDGKDYAGRRSVMFSGDMTAAPEPDGASELIYTRANLFSCDIITLNYYNYNENQPVPFDLIVAQEKPEDMEGDYMVDPNNVKVRVQSVIDKPNNVLGIAVSDINGCRFYFCQTSLGMKITSSSSKMMEQLRNYLTSFVTNPISFNNILISSHVEIVHDSENCDIDLSPEKIDKNTVIDMFS